MKTKRSLRTISTWTASASGLAWSFVGFGVGVVPNVGISQLLAPPTIDPPAATQPLANPSVPSPAQPTLATNDGLPPIVNSSSVPNNPLRDQAVNLTAQAKLALTRGDIASAKAFVEKANSLRIPETAYSPGQIRPWQIAMEIDRAERLRGSTAAATGGNTSAPSTPSAVQPASSLVPVGTAVPNGVVTAGATMPIGVTAPALNQPNPISSGVFVPKQDTTQTQAAAAQEATPSLASSSDGEQLFRDGVAALSAGERDKAMQLFGQAWKFERDLDPLVRAQLKDKLTLLQANRATQSQQQSSEPITAIQELSQEQNLTRQKMWREVTTEIAESEKMVNDNPNAALDRLQMLRQRISQSTVDGTTRKSHLAMVDRVIGNIQAYVDQNKPAIDQQERNRVIEDRIQLDAATKAKVSAEVQSMVEQYNELFQKKMYAEAEIIAKKVNELDPDTELSAVLLAKATQARRYQEQEDIRAMKSEMTAVALESVDLASVPFNDNSPILFPNAKDWSDKTRLRSQYDEGFQMTPAEKSIREALSEQVDVAFDDRTLSEALKTLSDVTGIPIVVDPLGLRTENIDSDTTVRLNLGGRSISLKSALNLILEPLNLTYVVKDEVLKITSRETSNRQKHTYTYNVKDLVMPIANFTSDYNSGLAGAIQSAYQASNSMLLVRTDEMSGTRLRDQQLASNGNGLMDASSAALGQFGPGMQGGMQAPMPGIGGMPGMMGGGNPPAMGSSSPFLNGNGGNGLGGGGSLANFGDLINLIQTTVESDWERDGGTDTIQEFAGNLSLIVSAPLETHEKIADLLKQLRSLQNLQVTIEVKFITLSDNFGEVMGMDFDFNIADKKLFDGDGLLRRVDGSTTIGLQPGQAEPTPTANLDIQFRQSSLGASVPAIGNPGTPATLGFAILSDLELFFFLQATQSDSRTNVLQAPKVTMFDGQSASVFDFASRPFVISLQPVVGDFAVAQQPVIVVLNDGTTLNVQSVVSPDKRYVRLTLNPSFTRIEDEDNTFTFNGRRTSNTGTVVKGPDGKPTTNRDNEQEVIEGSTVQLPTLGVTSVQTTVNVPDGGTILLGGIKRLQEGRSEQGLPILSKIPYLNRLFKNVSIGRTTNTLMMTVTPRIIIQEEEEANVIGSALP